MTNHFDRFIVRAQEVHGDKYDYSQVIYENSQKKVTIICPEHGEFEQTPASHLYGRGCRSCGYKQNGQKRKQSTDDFVSQAREVHGDKYDYSKVCYTGSYDPVIITCPTHGEFKQKPVNHIHAESGCVRCSREKQKKPMFNLEEQTIKEVVMSLKPGHYKSIDTKYPEIYARIVERTSFLNHREPTLKERLYCIKHDIDRSPLCESCGENEVAYDLKRTQYSRFCSFSCMANSSSVREKKKSTCNTRYGTNTPFESDEVKEKIKATNQERYGVDYLLSDMEWRKKKMIAKHGVEFPMQDKRFLDRATDNRVESDIQKKVQDTCEQKFGSRTFFSSHYFRSLPHDWSSSKGERELADWVESLGEDIIRNNRTIIGEELDVYIPEKNMAIEYCGLYWHSEDFKDKNYHQRKFQKCADKGIHLITIFEDEWQDATCREIVKERLSVLLGAYQGPIHYARKLWLQKAYRSDIEDFFEQEHLQGYVSFTVCYALYDGDKPVAAMSWIRKKSGVYELNRFAAHGLVVGAFSKLMKKFTRNHDFTEIVSFADCRWSKGDIYESNGFTLHSTLQPDYQYVKGTRRHHKFGFRKKAIASKFNVSVEDKTERELMSELGYKRIYDCGKLRYVLTK